MLLRKIKEVLKNLKSARISIKLTAMYAVMFSMVLLFLNASILFGVKYYLYNQANKQIEDMQAIISNKLSAQNGQADLTSKELFSDVPTRESIFIRIINEDGKILNSSPGFDLRFKLPHDNGKKLKGKERHLEDKERHIIYKNVQLQNDENGLAYLQIIKDMHSEYNFLEILFAVMAVADAIGIIVAIMLGYMVSKRMLKPIDYITKTADNISINNLKERIDVKGPNDELKRLANTFNKMIDRLQDAFNRQTQFISDASHELRTPIAIIQGYANLLDRWGKDDRDALEKSIYGIKLEAGNMASLIEKLLFLAKGESGQKVVEKKEFYLNELIDEVVAESRLIEKNHKITNSSNAAVMVLADYKMLKQMLRIFVENSLKFTSEDGTIDISSEANEREVEINVSDNGIGIPGDEIEKIFDRFYTVDKSRSKELGGTGLGLSIAKWIVSMHQGTIEVQSEEGKWTKVTVAFKLEE